MGRVIRTNSPTTVRNRARRTIAEMMRRVGEKRTMDDDVKDMAATIVLSLVTIDETIKQAITAWEKRDYWVKAERFQHEWLWVPEQAANLDDVLRHEAWDLIPDLLMELMPRFADVSVNKMTRKPDTWLGNYARLIDMKPLEQPY